LLQKNQNSLFAFSTKFLTGKVTFPQIGEIFLLKKKIILIYFNSVKFAYFADF